ncbi:MAG: transcriptional regulator, GntR family with aminotransferase domain [Acidimicrobiaceae bacterium]|nr:transcriptional regulator, GntR family with aminotransferase domain [Acidimicrobiaceae bacterium]
MATVSAARLVDLLGAWRGGGPAKEQLTAALRALVLDGRLPLETRVPAERALASALGVSRTTVAAAYDRLREEGYLVSRQGSGSWAAIPAGHRAADDALAPAGGLDLRVAALPAPAVMEELAREAVRELPRWLDHHGYDPLGLPPLREAIAERLSAQGLETRASQVLVTNGALHGLDLAVRATVRRGHNVIAELPSYPSALEALRRSGARLRFVPVGAHGWDLAALDELAGTGADLAYLIPDFQNPTGQLMEPAVREHVTRVLERTGAYVVVDETFRELCLDGQALPPPIGAFGGTRTITVGSLGKSVWGGLRIGWARADTATIHRLAAERRSLDLASPVLEQLVAVRALQRLDELAEDRRALARGRLEHLCGALGEKLPSWRYRRPSGGLALWAELPVPASTSLWVQARQRGLYLSPGSTFGAAGLLERFVRLPYTLAPAELTRAVDVLASLDLSVRASRPGAARRGHADARAGTDAGHSDYAA